MSIKRDRAHRRLSAIPLRIGQGGAGLSTDNAPCRRIQGAFRFRAGRNAGDGFGDALGHLVDNDDYSAEIRIVPCQSTERRHNQYKTDVLDLRPDHRTSAACTDPVMQSPFSTLAASVGKRRITRSSSPTPAARSAPAVHRCRRSARHSSSDGRRGYRRYGRVSPAPRRPKRSSAMFSRSCQRSPGNALMRSGIAAGSRTGSNLFTAPSVQRRRGRHKGQGSGRLAGKRFTQDRVGYGKTVVFGVFERQGQVHAEIVPDCSRLTLQGIEASARADQRRRSPADELSALPSTSAASWKRFPESR